MYNIVCNDSEMQILRDVVILRATQCEINCVESEDKDTESYWRFELAKAEQALSILSKSHVKRTLTV